MLNILNTRQADFNNHGRYAGDHVMMYIDTLKILVGQFVDLNKYITNDYHCPIVFLAIALSVYNEPTKASIGNGSVINPNILNTLGNGYSVLIPTLVMYDYNPNTIISQFRVVDKFNLYLNNMAYGRIQDTPLLNSYITVKDNHIQIVSFIVFMIRKRQQD